ncbi:MAG: 4Fe-4S binding protein [Acidobacteria bacterium]|nr:4Fe-4S binding protein [Acidobacteriota bacterium]
MLDTSTPVASSPSAPPVPPPRLYHAFRKRIHLICFLVFVGLPFFDVMRFDIPKQRFYFAGQEIWINEFAIIFFALMFLLFVIAGASMLYGRVYCSYFCPQMIFSELSLALEERWQKWINKHFIQWPAGRRKAAARVGFYATLAGVSVFLAFVFISYFVEPRDLIRRLMQFDIVTAGGIAGAVTTIFTFLDFAFVRLRFCKMICPYGYLQGMFSDKQTLLVVYRDGTAKEKACIECKKCVRVCHMGIDIRKSPFQIECIHCGECVEACDDVLARLKKPGLIHYTWGEQGELLGSTMGDNPRPWWYRMGLRDAKRAVVVFVLLFYASGLTVALSMRQTVSVRIQPDRTVLYATNEAGEITNAFRLNLANRGGQDSEIRIDAEGLQGARLVIPAEALRIEGGESRQIVFHVAVTKGVLPPGVNHFRFRATWSPKGTEQVYPMTFITPTFITPSK